MKLRKEHWFRQLPSLDTLLKHPAIEEAAGRYPRGIIVSNGRKVLDSLRKAIEAADEDELGRRNFSVDKLAGLVVQAIELQYRSSLTPVINATGTLIHTNLGRSPLPSVAVESVVEAASGYTNLEMDLNTGERSTRQSHVEGLLTDLAGAESAVVVNNNAAAVLLVLSALAAGKEVIVSRGELVEIGGSFRIPDVLRQSGARLREVGTTNKTRISDYAGAVGEETAVLLKVHTSNYRVVGFTETVGFEELVSFGSKHDLTVVADLGSGAFFDSRLYGLEDEPSVRQALGAGVELVTFSGDKLMGGPQCGLIVGKAELVKKLRGHPLYRALRPDKMALAALEAVARLWLVEETWKDIPVMAMLLADRDALEKRARKLAKSLAAVSGAKVEIRESTARVGGGAMPTQELPGAVVAISDTKRPVHEMAASLRQNLPPVVARVEDNALIIDPRTVFPSQETALTEALVRVIGEATS